MFVFPSINRPSTEVTMTRSTLRRTAARLFTTCPLIFPLLLALGCSETVGDTTGVAVNSELLIFAAAEAPLPGTVFLRFEDHPFPPPRALEESERAREAEMQARLAGRQFEDRSGVQWRMARLDSPFWTLAYIDDFADRLGTMVPGEETGTLGPQGFRYTSPCAGPCRVHLRWAAHEVTDAREVGGLWEASPDRWSSASVVHDPRLLDVDRPTFVGVSTEERHFTLSIPGIVLSGEAESASADIGRVELTFGMYERPGSFR
jgi:hypothetical protein